MGPVGTLTEIIKDGDNSTTKDDFHVVVNHSIVDVHLSDIGQNLFMKMTKLKTMKLMMMTHFLKRLSGEEGRPARQVSQEATRLLQQPDGLSDEEIDGLMHRVLAE